MATPPPCPVCGAPTVYLTAGKGPWSGQASWGCSRYRETGCPGKVNAPARDAITAPAAGASVQARFERERAIHRAKLRAVLPLATAVILIVMATVFLGLLSLQVQPQLAGLGAVVIGVLGIFGISRLPSEAVYWDKGARGERRTAEYLEPLLQRGFVVLHDRHLPGSRANIDHIAIGPSGVYVIETKNLTGTVEVTNDKLWVADHARQNYIDEVYREALATQIALSETLNPLRITVTPVLCVHGTRLPWFDHAVAGVHLVSGRQLRKLVEGAPSLMTDEQVQRVATVADDRLRANYSWEARGWR